MKKLLIALLLPVCCYAQTSAKFRNLDAYVTNGAIYSARMFKFPKKVPSVVAERTLTASVGATLTFTAAMGGCPMGVAGANTLHNLYISGGTGTAEAVLITGGTCTSGAASGTITFTPANNHSGAWTIESATAGIMEALAVVGQIGIVEIPPGIHDIYATVHISERRSVEVRGSGMGDLATGTVGTILRWQGASGGSVVKADGLAYSLVRNFEIAGNSLAGIGLEVTNAAGGSTAIQSLFHNIRIRNVTQSPGYGLKIGNTNNLQVDTNTFRKFHIEDSLTADVYYIGQQTVGNYLEDFTILTSTATDSIHIASGSVYVDGFVWAGSNRALRVTPTADVRYAHFNNMTLEASATSPILFDAAAGGTLNYSIRNTKLLYNGVNNGRAIDVQHGCQLTLQDVVIHPLGATAATIFIDPQSAGDSVDLTEVNVFLAQSPAIISRDYTQVQGVVAGSLTDPRGILIVTNYLNTEDAMFMMRSNSPSYGLNRIVWGNSVGGLTGTFNYDGALGGQAVTGNSLSCYGNTAGTALTETCRFGNGASPQFEATQGIILTQPTINGEVFRAQSTATNDDPIYRASQGRAATTNATTTTLQAITVSASKTTLIEARIVARRTGGTAGTAEDGAAYILRAAYKMVGGVSTQIGSDDLVVVGESQAAWTVATSSTGAGAVNIQVTGAADNNITWHVTVLLQDVGT